MKSGDLVEFIQPDGGDEIVVGGMDDGLTWRRSAGTLAAHLGRHPRMPGEPAIVVLIDGKLGWIWEYWPALLSCNHSCAWYNVPTNQPRTQMNTPTDITAKLEAIRVVKSPHSQPERVERLFQKRHGWLMAFASFYTVLPKDEWLSVTKASIAGGGTSGMGQAWATQDVKDMATKGYVATRQRGNRQWVRPLSTAALLEWAQLPVNLAHEGMDLAQWADHGRSWVAHMRGD